MEAADLRLEVSPIMLNLDRVVEVGRALFVSSWNQTITLAILLVRVAPED